MAVNGQEPVGSMGTDTPLAVLSDKPQPLFNYFKQLFAQVTNPPIDPIREEMVTSAETSLGAEQNLFEESPAHCRQLQVKQPILTNAELERIRTARQTRPARRRPSRRSTRSTDGAKRSARCARPHLPRGLRSDRPGLHASWCCRIAASTPTHAPIPCLLATGAVHHHLIREGTRTRCGIVVESGEPREVMHFCLLVGYGAAAVNPYLAFATMAGMIATAHTAASIDGRTRFRTSSRPSPRA